MWKPKQKIIFQVSINYKNKPNNRKLNILMCRKVNTAGLKLLSSRKTSLEVGSWLASEILALDPFFPLLKMVHCALDCVITQLMLNTCFLSGNLECWKVLFGRKCVTSPSMKTLGTGSPLASLDGNTALLITFFIAGKRSMLTSGISS